MAGNWNYKNFILLVIWKIISITNSIISVIKYLPYLTCKKLAKIYGKLRQLRAKYLYKITNSQLTFDFHIKLKVSKKSNSQITILEKQPSLWRIFFDNSGILSVLFMKLCHSTPNSLDTLWCQNNLQSLLLRIVNDSFWKSVRI